MSERIKEVDDRSIQDCIERLKNGKLAPWKVEDELEVVYGIKLPAPDWVEQAKISRITAPVLGGFGQNKPQNTTKPSSSPQKVEALLEKMNDLNTNLHIIKENFVAGNLQIHEASRFAERVIRMHHKRFNPDEWESKTSESFKLFMKELLPKEGGKEVRIIVPD